MPLLVGLLVVGVGVLLAPFAAGQPKGWLDPSAVDGSGSRALATLLAQQGVRLRVAHTARELAGAGRDTTVLVALPERLGPAQRQAAHVSPADVVLVEPKKRETLSALAPGVQASSLFESVTSREPACGLAEARAAGRVAMSGVLYRSSSGVSCYPGIGGSALIRLTDGTRTITLLGSSDPLTNEALAEEGNAALVMRLLGAHPQLMWFLPAPETPAAGEERTLLELVPAGWRWAAAQLALAALLAVPWRARRLGPVVSEPLPVVVRAAETVEGRARLYQAANDREHAATTLRAASRARLATQLGLGSGVGTAALVARIAERTGRPSAEVGSLLDGEPPADDKALVRLAAALDECEREVSRS